MPWQKAESIGPIPAPSFYDQLTSWIMQNNPQGNEARWHNPQMQGAMEQMTPMIMGGASPIRGVGAGPSQSVLMDIYHKLMNRGRVPPINPAPISQGIPPGTGMRPPNLPVNDPTYKPLNVLRDPQYKSFAANSMFGRR